jgi:TPR repeat protein
VLAELGTNQMVKKGFCAVVLVAAMLISVPAAADFDSAVAAYERRDYKTALVEFKPLADQGIASAQFYLGIMYYNGQGVPEDDAEGMKWIRRAADQGDAEAQGDLGWMYFRGKGVPEDYVQAYGWLNLAAAQGSRCA